MDEADLVLLAQFLLSGLAVRDPHIGLMAAQNLLGDTARAPGDPVQDGLFREKDPGPMEDTVGAGGGLVGCDDPCGQRWTPRKTVWIMSWWVPEETPADE